MFDVFGDLDVILDWVFKGMVKRREFDWEWFELFEME